MNATSTNATSLDVIRANPQLRSAYLDNLLKISLHRIEAVVRQNMGNHDRGLLSGEAQQAFLLAANKALDSARTEDDGRGKNDPAKWCAYRGMLAVVDAMRNVRGRADRPSIKFHMEARSVSFYADTGHHHNAIDPTDYEESTLSALVVKQFIDSLPKHERDVVALYVFGENDHTRLHCNCIYGAAKHSVLRDVAQTIGYSEAYVSKILRGLRERVGIAFAVTV